MQIGDIVYAKMGLSKLVGRGIVKSDYFHDETRADKPVAVGKSVSINTRNDSELGIMGCNGTTIVRIAVIRVLLEDGTDLQLSGDDAVWYEGSV